MAAALMVTLVGFGIVALGLVSPDFYEIGVVVVFIGGVGVLVRTVEWLRWLLRD
jgi:hypothetical protein